ncbi:MAG: glycosyltransferase family 4 protein, partial [Thermoanaerobaculia bacterium]
TMAERLRARGIHDVRVIHNWADGDAIRPAPTDPHSLRAEWGWQGRFVVLYSGNFGLAHEFETLLDAANLLRGRPEVRFAFVGGGPRLDEVKRRAGELALPNVEFHPYVSRSDLGLSLTAADLHVVTLRRRMPGLLVPSKVYGILAAGRPTLYVGPPEGEIHDIVREARCGTTVENGDAESLAMTIRGYIENRWQCEEEGRRARQVFDDRFAKGKALEEWAKLIESLGSMSSPRPEEIHSPAPTRTSS